MATFKAVVLKAKNQVKADGTANIKIRITHRKKIAYLPTDYYVHVKHMNNKKGLVEGGPNEAFINKNLLTEILKLRTADLKLGNARQYLDISEYKQQLLAGDGASEKIDFYVFSEKIIANTHVQGTADQYSSLVKSLKKFKEGRLYFSEINLFFLRRYERFLCDNGAKNGIINYMRTFRSLFNKGRDYYNNEDFAQIRIPHYPFKKYEFPKRKVKSREHVLTPSELKLLIDAQPEHPGHQFARDMFLLMFFLIGIEAKDLFYANKPENGRLEYQRFKTDGFFSVKLEPEAARIVEKYKGKTKLLNVSERFARHKSFYRYINNYLVGEDAHNIKGLLPELGIHKPVTTKWARHTWATIARNDCRINKSDVALCLGHQDIDNRVTDMYIKYDYLIVDESNRKVINYLNDQ